MADKETTQGQGTARSNRADPRIWSTSGRVIVGLGVIVHLAGFFLFEVELQPSPPLETPAMSVALIDQDDGAAIPLLAQRAAFSDSEPLFLPTTRNAGPLLLPEEPLMTSELPLPAWSQGRLWQLPQLNAFRSWNNPVENAAPFYEKQPVSDPKSAFPTFATTPREQHASREPQVTFTVRSTRLNEPRHLHLAREQLSALPKGEWGILELAVIRDESGVKGQPVLIRSSGNAEVDTVFLDMMKAGKFLKIDEPGYYEVVIGF